MTTSADALKDKIEASVAKMLDDLEAADMKDRRPAIETAIKWYATSRGKASGGGDDKGFGEDID